MNAHVKMSDEMVLSLWRGLIPAAPKFTRMADVVEWVAAKHGISIEDLKGPSRVRSFAYARQEAMWEMCQTGRWSTTLIGRFLGGRDHTTVMHGRDAHQARLDAMQTEEAA